LSFIKVFAQQFEGLNPFRNHPTLMVYLVWCKERGRKENYGNQ
jgi:hypothetical protein